LLLAANGYRKHRYFYLDDEEFGPCFIKVGSCFPFPVRICVPDRVVIQ